jgi:epoxyqueuosine reductase
MRTLAIEAGFQEAGVLALPYAAEERDAARFEQWIAAGRAGSMDYLKRRQVSRKTELSEADAPTEEKPQETADAPLIRARPAIPFPWARSVVVCFAGYHCDQPLSTQPAPQDSGWIARYAWSSRIDPGGARRPSDYHKVLKKRLTALEAGLRARYGSFEARGYVDTGPVVERSLATAAGLGWTGKNTCLIHPKLGSFGFLAVLVTSLELPPTPTPLTVPDRCGSCRRCLDACPTGALTAPYQMDATRCISYLTIEHRGPIDRSLMAGMGRQVFGCDICQDVCPWNRKAPIASDPQLDARPELVNPSLDWLAELDEAAFERLFNGSPVRRTGFAGLRRNTAIAIGNSGVARFTPLLTNWANATDQGLRTAAQWALARILGSTRPSTPG